MLVRYIFTVCTETEASYPNSRFQHPSLDSSVVSAEHSILFANGEMAGSNNNNNSSSSKDGVIKEILRRKLLALDSDETRL